MPTSAEVICAHCLRQTPSFDQVSALFTYRFPIDRCINLIKTQRQPAYLGHLAALAASHFQDRRQPDYILPIPMHWISQQRRGFNHAQLLAEQLGKRLQLPVQDSCLIKHRATQQQHSLSKIERRRNLRNVFSCRYPPARHVVLVDDVMTTGATLQEASRVLKQQGTEIVDAWVLARTP
ncbi:ComF family protein [Pontibacter sp. JAM-7]|uniref:ComF family protein n=1 Tax=Pontibacter sp. JAM-7 TaxID=3366581 RepID=UPI003AF41948